MSSEHSIRTATATELATLREYHTNEILAGTDPAVVDLHRAILKRVWEEQERRR